MPCNFTSSVGNPEGGRMMGMGDKFSRGHSAPIFAAKLRLMDVRSSSSGAPLFTPLSAPFNTEEWTFGWSSPLCSWKDTCTSSSWFESCQQICNTVDFTKKHGERPIRMFRLWRVGSWLWHVQHFHLFWLAYTQQQHIPDFMWYTQYWASNSGWLFTTSIELNISWSFRPTTWDD